MLISIDRASELVPNFQASDRTVLSDCVQAASDTIERYCNRTFSLQNYDELYDGTGGLGLYLRNYPIQKIDRISHTPTSVVQIRNTDQVVQRASFRLDGWTPDNVRGDYAPTSQGSLYLVSVKNGLTTTITINLATGATTVNGTPGTTYTIVTLGDLATVINTFSAYGWAALALGIYTTWSVADIRPPQPARECKWYGSAYLKLHSWQLMDYEINSDVGEVVCPFGFTVGYKNIRVIYTAGFNVIPLPVQQACAALAVSVYQFRGQNANLSQEQMDGMYSYQRNAETAFKQLDLVSKYGLALYRNHSVARYKVI